MGPQLSDPEPVLRRHNRNFPCPICRGRAETPNGRGLRCAGFTLGRVAFCTREQYAASLILDVATSPPAFRHSLSKVCDCGQRHGEQFFSPHPFPNAPTQPERPKRTPVPIEARHVVYSAALELLDLRDEAKDELISRGLSHEAIDQAGYKSIPRLGAEHRNFIAKMAERFCEESLGQCPGFTDEDGRLDFWAASGTRDGYVVPYRDEHGFISGLQQKILGGKYLTARGSALSSVYHLSGTGGPGNDLYVTEGATKATVASYLGGIWTFSVAGQSLKPEHIDVIKRLRPGRVIVALDQEDNVSTDRARERWCETLLKNGLRVFTAIWEGQALGSAQGLDDLLLLGHYPRIYQVCQVTAERGSALGLADDLTLSEMQSEIGKYHMGPGEVRHGGGGPSQERDVPDRVITKNPLYRKSDKPRDRGKRSRLWAEAKDLFPIPTHVKPGMRGYLLWSERDRKGLAVDLFSNTWRNPANAQHKRQKLYTNILPRINGPQIYQRRVPIDDWDKTVHRRISRALQRATTGDQGWMWFDNALERGYIFYLTSAPGIAGFEPVENVRHTLIDALKSIHPPDRDEGERRFRPYGGSKN